MVPFKFEEQFMKTFKSRTVLLFAVSAAFGAAAHADSTGNVSWGAYRSIVNPSVDVDSSFNRTTSVDASRTATDSFNRTSSVDASRHTTDSFNRSLDVQTVTPTVNSTKSIATVDAQSASNTGYMDGAKQSGTQGGFSLNMGGGQPTSASGGSFFSPATARTNQTYDVNQANTAYVGRDNNGSIRNQNNLNIGGSQITDSDLGNKQSLYVGPQTQVQGNEQHKDSSISTSASDTVSTKVSK
jgi:hypothetical protein